MSKRRRSGAARANYSFRKYLSELDYKARTGPDRGQGCNEIADQLRAAATASSCVSHGPPMERTQSVFVLKCHLPYQVAPLVSQ